MAAMNMFLLLPTCGVLLLAGLARGEELVASQLDPIPSHIGTECELVFVVALGAFQNQGKYDLSSSPDMTVSELIRRAGGHTSQKAVPKIQIVRRTPQGNKRILVNAKAVLIQKCSEYDLFLRRDDFVIVE